MRKNEEERAAMEVDNEDGDIELLKGKLKREELKKELFVWMDSSN